MPCPNEKRRAWGEDQQAPFTPPGTRRLTSGVFVRRQSPPTFSSSPRLPLPLSPPPQNGEPCGTRTRIHPGLPRRGRPPAGLPARVSPPPGESNPGTPGRLPIGVMAQIAPRVPSPLAPSRSALRRTEGLGGGTRPARGPRAALRAVRTVVFNASAGGLAVFRLRVYVCRSRANAVPRRGRRLAGLPDPKP